MSRTTASFLLWAPRILGILVAVFLAMFALDAFGEHRSIASGVTDFAVHLVPSLAILGIVLLSWRWPWIGAVACLLIAVGYAVIARDRLDWVVTISGTLAALGLFFLVSWQRDDAIRAAMR